nr:MAG TPA: hypothetical protein [Caudoviricetes sp.]
MINFDCLLSMFIIVIKFYFSILFVTFIHFLY